jgi:hypothetical protein
MIELTSVVISRDFDAIYSFYVVRYSCDVTDAILIPLPYNSLVPLATVVWRFCDGAR